MPNSLPSLNGLRAFEASARLQSFKKASEELFVTPSAISQQVKGLEDFLGVHLFDRLPQGVALTQAGRELLPALEKAFADISSAVRHLRSDIRNPLRISAPPAFSSLWLAPRLQAFETQHPRIAPSLHSSLDLIDFNKDSFDCAIRTYFQSPNQRQERDTDPNLMRMHLFDIELFCVCNPELLVNKKGEHRLPRAPEQVSDYNLLHYRDYSTWAMWARFHGASSLDTNAGIVCNSVDALARTAAGGQGLALVDEVVLNESKYKGYLEPFFLDKAPYRIEFYFVAPQNSWNREAVQTFYEWLSEQSAGMRGYYGFEHAGELVRV